MNLLGNRLSTLILFIAFLLGVFPIWLSSQEFWDGAITEYALLIGDKSGAELHFPKLNLFLAHELFLLADWLYHDFHIPGWLSIKLWLTLMIVLISIEVRLLGERVFKVPNEFSFWLNAFVLAYPAWYAYFSYTPMIGHVTAAFMVLFSHRLICEKKGFLNLLGWILLVGSFQLNSAMAFIIGLELTGWLLRDKDAPSSYRRACAVVSLAILNFLLYKLLLPLEGGNEKYNSILSPLRMDSWLIYLKYSAGYSSWFILLLPSVLGYAYLKKNFFTADQDYRGLQESAQSWRYFAAFLILFFLASLPYIVVGKGHALFSIGQFGVDRSVGLALSINLNPDGVIHPFVSLWSSRHLILFMIPSAIISVWLISNRVLSGSRTLTSAHMFLMLGIVFQLCWGLIGHADRLKRTVQSQSMINAFKSLPEPRAGLVDILLPKNSGYAMQIHESNMLMYKSYGVSKWATLIMPDISLVKTSLMSERSQFLARIPESNHALRMMGVMREYSGAPCTTLYSVDFPRFSLLDVLWTLAQQSQRVPSASIAKMSERCD